MQTLNYASENIDEAAAEDNEKAAEEREEAAVDRDEAAVNSYKTLRSYTISQRSLPSINTEQVKLEKGYLK